MVSDVLHIMSDLRGGGVSQVLRERGKSTWLAAVSHPMVRQIGDGPANVEQLVKEPDSVFETLGIPRDVETFLKSGTFQRRLKNKDTIVNAWSEIRAGL